MAPRRDTAALRRLGTRVRKERDARGLSQEALAWEAKIHTNHLSSIERGEANPSFLVLLSISRVLGVKLSELVGD
ncbi:MAG TPA: helix-turn-helix transcriptional regulator [Thermoanaerobaculia bacterium]|nr:helix-turn-helix transcriptional regulator [Thermoanaerobaculia bacterium]